MPNPNFPIKIMKTSIPSDGCGFINHWHEHIELLYFIEGSATAFCGSTTYEVLAGDLVLVNSSELHSLQNNENILTYYCIIYNLPLLLGATSDTCDAKYLSPISHSNIVFENLIRNSAECNDCIEKLIFENENESFGYELEVKSLMLHLLSLLLRNHIARTLTPREYNHKIQTVHRFEKLFQHIETNFASPLTTKDCAVQFNLSLSHFCHLFKETTGQGFIDYINKIRINKAQILIKDTDMSITEIALAVGFNDLGYFTRLFKKITKNTPTGLRKNV